MSDLYFPATITLLFPASEDIMSIKKALVISLLVCAYAGHAIAQKSFRSTDVMQMDIAGVKLGMTTEDAVAKIVSNFKVNKSTLRFDPYPQEDAVTRSKQARYFTARKGVESLTVHLSPKIPHDAKNPMRVSLVIYEMRWTADNAKSMREAALRKFGTPSNGQIPVQWEWCMEPDSNPGHGCKSHPGEKPTLELAGTKLALSDPRYTRAYSEYVAKKNSGKPSF